MQVVINEKNKLRLNKFLDWFLYFIGYTIVFILVTTLFKSIHIDKNHFILWSTIIVFIVYLLNKTIKPVLVTLTIPIKAITLGLFYPCITNLFVAIFAAVLLSITNFIMEEIIKTIINKVKTHE